MRRKNTVTFYQKTGKHDYWVQIHTQHRKIPVQRIFIFRPNPLLYFWSVKTIKQSF